ncbi:glycosyltransferase [bacterium]|nr:glycosyltransferase [bacterium]
MKKLLLIAYDFPPSSLGIWRTLKFCRYMGEFGWHPSILTVRPVRSPRHDMGPMSELPSGIEVRRTHSLDTNRLAWMASQALARVRGRSPASAAPRGKAAARSTFGPGRAVMDVLRSWLLIPDDRAGWYPFALAEGRRWLRQERFDAIYSTCYPHTAHVVGERLARESGLPFLADFRDIWIGSYVFYHPATAWHDRLQRNLERRVVSRAARVVTATDPITTDFRERYPDLPPERFATITNGFDTGDFTSLPVKPDTDHFTITFTGTLFGSASPRSYFEAIARVLTETPRWRDALRLRFAGSMIEPFRAMIGEFGLDAITRVDAYLPHDEALTLMAEADALLLIVPPTPGSHIMLTQKVFEYVAARRPVLGLVPDGAARDFLREIGEGTVVDPDDVAGIAAAITAMLSEWERAGRKTLGDNPRLNRYTRRELTRQLCTELDEIAK